MINPLQPSQLPRRAAIAALALIVLLALGVSSAQAQTFNLLYSFTGPQGDGSNPYAGVIQDSHGNLYGTTFAGGSSQFGVVFKLDTAGNETVLHNFTGPDGEIPYSGLLLDKSGNLYGTTTGGGSAGYGVVFKLNPSGKLTVLHSFTGNDGCNPQGGVIMDAQRNLYGAAPYCGSAGGGTVWKLSENGKLTVLHNFQNGANDGANPLFTTLLADKKGNLYGFTSMGGSDDQGIAYKLSAKRKLTVLHSFTGGQTDGCGPLGAPLMDAKSNLYGTAGCGSADMGVVWKLSKTGKETILHNFTGGSSDGETPWAGVVLDAQANLYGDTEEGGSSGYGVVYELTPSGTITLLHSFTGRDGATPFAGVLRNAKGDLYGTTVYGANNGRGGVWSLTP